MSYEQNTMSSNGQYGNDMNTDGTQSNQHQADTHNTFQSAESETDKPNPDNTDKSESKAVCRDFMRGGCNRTTCKYDHPETDQPKKLICKDYQKSKCFRARCRYLHLTTSEEAEYEKTGILPENTNKPVQDVEREQCKDFLNGDCRRGQSCKYFHPDLSSAIKGFGLTKGLLDQLGATLYGQLGTSLYGKRRCDALNGLSLGTLGGNMKGSNLVEENDELKKKVIELRSQVLDLTQMNDTLYAENMKFRQQLSNVDLSVGVAVDPKISILPRPMINYSNLV